MAYRLPTVKNNVLQVECLSLLYCFHAFKFSQEVVIRVIQTQNVIIHSLFLFVCVYWKLTTLLMSPSFWSSL